MTKNVPALIARTHFGQILERASQNNERFVITKKGEAKVIILGVEDFLQAVENPPASLVELQKQAKRSGTYEMTLEDIEKEIESVRGVKQKHPAKREIHKQKT